MRREIGEIFFERCGFAAKLIELGASIGGTGLLALEKPGEGFVALAGARCDFFLFVFDAGDFGAQQARLFEQALVSLAGLG